MIKDPSRPDQYFGKDRFPIPDFPLAVRYTNHGNSVPLHAHDFFEAVMVIQGNAENTLANHAQSETFALIPGDVFIIMPGEKHSYSFQKPFVIYDIMFKIELIEDFWPDLQCLQSWEALFDRTRLEHRKVHLSITERIAAEQCLKKMIFAFSLKPMGIRAIGISSLFEFFTIIGQGDTMPSAGNILIGNEGIQRTIATLEQSPEKDFQLNALARVACMSVSSYTRKFREFTGISPIDYLIRLRLDKAKQMLAETSLTISDIAEEVGFYDNNHLIKYFRQRFKITPGKYRDILKPVNTKKKEFRHF